MEKTLPIQVIMQWRGATMLTTELINRLDHPLTPAITFQFTLLISYGIYVSKRN